MYRAIDLSSRRRLESRVICCLYRQALESKVVSRVGRQRVTSLSLALDQTLSPPELALWVKFCADDMSPPPARLY
jgi:hypothetical protein